jgi:hypothetical protein
MSINSFFVFSLAYISIIICKVTFSGLLLTSVIFSAVEKDADSAVELKNGSLVGGRKISVKHAMPRPPREKKSKPDQGRLMLASNSL